MANADDVRRLTVALPHVEAIDSDGFDFRVAGRGFIGSYQERRQGQPRRIRTDIAVLYVATRRKSRHSSWADPRYSSALPSMATGR